jgi:hypothetical protein
MDPRSSHVKRIRQVTTDPETGEQSLADDVWIDVLRLDKLPINFRSTDLGASGQLIAYVLVWNDDPFNPAGNIDASNADAQFENANASRKTVQIDVQDPGVPSASSDNSVKLWIINQLTLIARGQDFPQGWQNRKIVFNNLPADGSKGTPAKRQVSVLKIVNNDLNGMKMIDDDGKPFVVAWETYRQALQDGKSDPDDPLYLTVEFPDRFTLDFGADALLGTRGQHIAYVPTGYQAIENLFEAGDPEALNADGNSALIRTDPLQVIVNCGSNIIAVEFSPPPLESPAARESEYMWIPNTTAADANKITISTWVYIPKTSVDQAAKDAKTLDHHAADENTQRGIPIMEFGGSVEPRVGVHIGMGMTWEGFLGIGIWNAVIGAPTSLTPIADFYISAHGIGPGAGGVDPHGQWNGFYTLGRVANSLSYAVGWEDGFFDFLGAEGTLMAGFCSFFYADAYAPGVLAPEPRYEGFHATGIRDFNVKNDNVGDFPVNAFRLEKAGPANWHYDGYFTVTGDCQRCYLLAGDKTVGSVLINSEVVFSNFWADPKNNTLQPTPTDGPDEFQLIRVDTGGTGKYFAYGDIVFYFPERPGVTYGVPANPSALFYTPDGAVNFTLSGVYPGASTPRDLNIVPTLVLSCGGFKLDSWNHIFFTIDLTTMGLTGGNTDPTKQDLTQDPPVNIPVHPPDMTTAPKCAMLVNGGTPNKDIQAELCSYMEKVGFKMMVKNGQIGLPIIPQEIGRYQMTGKNQKIRYAYTHVWFNQYIEPTEKNLSYFFTRSKNPKFNNVVPPADKKGAVKKFGKPDIWCYRDKLNNVAFERNQGKAGTFKTSPANTAPKDFRPGPGQSAKPKTTTP